MSDDNQEMKGSSLDQMVDKKPAPSLPPQERYQTNHLGSPVALKHQEQEDRPAPRSWMMRAIDRAVAQDIVPNTSEKLDSFGLGIARKNNFSLRALTRKVGRQVDLSLPKKPGLRKLELHRQAQIMRTIGTNAALGSYQFQRAQVLPFMRKTVALNYQKISILKQVVTSITAMEKSLVSKLEAIKLNTGASAPAKLGLFKQLSIATRERSINRAATNISNFWMDGYENHYRNIVSPRLAKLYGKIKTPGVDGGVNGVTGAIGARAEALRDRMKTIAGGDKPQSMMGRMGQLAAKTASGGLGFVARAAQMAKLSDSKNDFVSKLVTPGAERLSKFSPFAPIFPQDQNDTGGRAGVGSSTGITRQLKLLREESKTYFAKSLEYLAAISGSLGKSKPTSRLRRPDGRKMFPRDSSEVNPNTDLNASSRNIVAELMARAKKTGTIGGTSDTLLSRTKAPRGGRLRSLTQRIKNSSAMESVQSLDLATASMVAGTGAAIASNQLTKTRSKLASKLGLYLYNRERRKTDRAEATAHDDHSGDKQPSFINKTQKRLSEFVATRKAAREESRAKAERKKQERVAAKEKAAAQRLQNQSKPRKNSYEDIVERTKAVKAATAARMAAAAGAVTMPSLLSRDRGNKPDQDAPEGQSWQKTSLLGAGGALALGMGKRLIKGGLRGGWKATSWMAGKGLKFAPKGLGLAGRGAGMAGGLLFREARGLGRLGLSSGASGAKSIMSRLPGVAKFGGKNLLRFAKSPIGIGIGAEIAKHYFDKSGVKGTGKRLGDTGLDMLSYGATGAALGSFVPIVGTTLGAVAGATYGLVSNNLDLIFGQDAVVDTDGKVLRQRKASLLGNLKIALFGRKAEYSKSGELIAPAKRSFFGAMQYGMDNFFFGEKGKNGKRTKGTSFSEKVSKYFSDMPNRAKDQFRAIGDMAKNDVNDAKNAWKAANDNGTKYRGSGLQAALTGAYNWLDNTFQGDKTIVVPGKRGRATPDEVSSMLKQAIPGVRVTSTTGGRHAKNSWHYKGQAIDFVPPGGMGSMTKQDVYRKFQAMGLNILQVLGPGDKGHSDHFHVAWSNGSPGERKYFGQSGIGGLDSNGAANFGGSYSGGSSGSSFFNKNDFGASNGPYGSPPPKAGRASAKMAQGNVGKQPEYQAAYQKLPPAIRKMVDKSPQLRFVLWSTAVQHGPDTASAIFQKDYDPEKDEKSYTRSIYQDRATRFTNLSSEDRSAAIGRLSNEEKFTENFRNGASPTRAQFQEQLSDMITPDTYLPTGNISGSKGQRAKMAFQFFKNKGYTTIAAAGIVAQLMAESQVDPHPAGSNDNGKAHGVAQWHRDRQDSIARQFGKPVQKMNLLEQLTAVDWEIKNGINGRGNPLFGKWNSAKTVEESVGIGVDQYEIPADKPGAKRERNSYAHQLLKAMGNQPTAAPVKQPAAPAASAPSAQPRKPKPPTPQPNNPQSRAPRAAPAPAAPSQESLDNFRDALRENTMALREGRGSGPMIQQNNSNVISPFLNRAKGGNFVTMSMDKSKLAVGDY